MLNFQDPGTLPRCYLSHYCQARRRPWPGWLAALTGIRTPKHREATFLVCRLLYLVSSSSFHVTPEPKRPGFHVTPEPKRRRAAARRRAPPSQRVWTWPLAARFGDCRRAPPARGGPPPLPDFPNQRTCLTSAAVACLSIASEFQVTSGHRSRSHSESCFDSWRACQAFRQIWAMSNARSQKESKMSSDYKRHEMQMENQW